MISMLGEWREGKVRPVPGNVPHDRPVGRGYLRPGAFATIPPSPLDSRSFKYCRDPRQAFFRHAGIYLVRWGFNTNP